jgi:hypothetical protein
VPLAARSVDNPPTASNPAQCTQALKLYVRNHLLAAGHAADDTAVSSLAEALAQHVESTTSTNAGDDAVPLVLARALLAAIAASPGVQDKQSLLRSLALVCTRTASKEEPVPLSLLDAMLVAAENEEKHAQIRANILQVLGVACQRMVAVRGSGLVGSPSAAAGGAAELLLRLRKLSSALTHDPRSADAASLALHAAAVEPVER